MPSANKMTTPVAVGLIAQLTRGQGPYPRPPTGGAGRGTVDPRTVRRWVQDRQSGISLVAIARDSETTAEKVGRATKPYGPFPSPRRAPPGYMTFRQVSARLGISRPALQRRLEQDELPEPAGNSDSGWPYWRAGKHRTVDRHSGHESLSHLRGVPQTT